MNWTTKSILDCSWLPYNGPRKLNLDNMMQQAHYQNSGPGSILAFCRSSILVSCSGQAGLDTDADLTLNVTILTTVRPALHASVSGHRAEPAFVALVPSRRPGYLWSFPTASAFFWLRERTPAPQVVQASMGQRWSLALQKSLSNSLPGLGAGCSEPCSHGLVAGALSSRL